MKIIHLSSSDTSGGAARSTYRIHRSLLNQGIDSKIFVNNKHSDDKTIIGPSSKIEKYFSSLNQISKLKNKATIIDTDQSIGDM